MYPLKDYQKMYLQLSLSALSFPVELAVELEQNSQNSTEKEPVNAIEYRQLLYAVEHRQSMQLSLDHQSMP